MRKTLHLGSPYESPRIQFSTGRTSGLGIRAVFGGDDQDFGVSAHVLGRHVHVGLSGFIPQSIRSAAYDWAKRKAEEAKKRVEYARTTCASQDTLFELGRRTYAYQFDPFNGREVSASLSREFASVNLWTDMDHNVGYHKGVFPKTALFGEPTIDEDIVDSRDTQVVLPEGDYNAEWSLRYSTYAYNKRLARIPGVGRLLKRVYYTSHLSVPDGLPFPGKGENSWNCGDDAVYSTSYPVAADEWARESPGAATRRIALEVMERRLERGGPLVWKKDADSEADDQPNDLDESDMGFDPLLCSHDAPSCSNCGRGLAHDMACPRPATVDESEPPPEASTAE